MAQSLDQLIAARAIQALGGGALVPVATAAASHLFEGHDRPRALGVIGALTFLGMAAGPFLGAAILDAVQPAAALARLGLLNEPIADFLAPAWRYVFYINVPIGLAALAIGWAATAGWDTPRSTARVDVLGAVLFTIALGALLLGITLLGRGGRGAGGRPGPRRHLRHPDRRRAGRRGRRGRPGPAPPGSLPRPAALHGPGLRVRRAREPPDRLCVRHRDRRVGRLRGPRAVRRSGRPAPGPRRPRRRHGRRRPGRPGGSSGAGRCAP